MALVQIIIHQPFNLISQLSFQTARMSEFGLTEAYFVVNIQVPYSFYLILQYFQK